MSDLDPDLLALIENDRFGTLATIKRDGRPQQSTILYGFDSGSRVVRISVTDTRAKTKNLQRDPRMSLHVRGPNVWSWVVAEGVALLTPVATTPDDDVVAELVDLYQGLAGEHPDWDDYRQAQIAEQRRVLRLPIERVYGQAAS